MVLLCHNVNLTTWIVYNLNEKRAGKIPATTKTEKGVISFKLSVSTHNTFKNGFLEMKLLLKVSKNIYG